MKVKVTIQFRGREVTYPEIAMEDMKEIEEALSDVGVVEQRPNMEGHRMVMILAPIKQKGAKKK